VAQLGAYVPLACIRNMQRFATTNLVANALILYALGVLTAHAGAGRRGLSLYLFYGFLDVFLGSMPAEEVHSLDARRGSTQSDTRLSPLDVRRGTTPPGTRVVSNPQAPASLPLFNKASFYLFVGTSAFVCQSRVE